MILGYDLDKVFIDYPPLIPDKVVDRLYKKNTRGPLLYRIPSRPEIILRQLSHMHFLRPAIKKNIIFLETLPRMHHKLYLISSRFSFLEKLTYTLMEKRKLDKIFDAMFFNYENEQPHIFKDAIIKRLGIERYVDDDFQLLKYLAKQNKNVQFYWLNPQKGKHMLTRNITAISSLEDMLT